MMKLKTDLSILKKIKSILKIRVKNMNLLTLDYKKNKHKITLVFIIIIAISLTIVLLPFILRGNYFLWTGLKMDGATQHSTFLAYLDSVGGLKNIGNYDFYAGLGNDFLFSYIYYMILDPFNILLLLPINNLPLVYSLEIVCKFIASAVFMFLFLKYKNIKPIINIVISVFYMLSGFAVFTFVRHPDLAAGAVFLPLMILGLEKVMKNQKPYILIVSTFLCLCSSFYMFFMSSVFVVMYAIIYYFEINNKPYSFKKFLLAMLKTGGYYLLAIMLASFFLIPVIYMYPTAARSVSKGLLLYNLKYYLGVFISSVTSIAATNFTPLGLNIIVLALMIPFYYIKGNKTLKVILAILGIGLFVPMFGYAINLFNYVNNRWVYLLDFTVALASAITLNHYFSIKLEDKIKKQIKNILSGFALVFTYSGFVYLGFILLKKYFSTLYLVLTIFVLLLFLLLVIYLYLCILKEKILKIKYKFTFKGVLITLYILSVFMPTAYYIQYSSEFNGWEYFYNQQKAEEKYISSLNTNEFFRTDADSEGNNYNNAPVINEYMGTFSYNTLSNGLVNQFFNENGIYNQTDNLGISGLNKRSALTSLLSVKYYLKNGGILPYGFNENLAEYNNIYKNSNYLPLGIVFNNSVSKEYYNSLSYIEKQALLLEAVVIDNGNDYNYTKKTITSDYEMQLNNVSIENNIISVKKEGGSITFNINDTTNKELYLSILNLVPIESDPIYYGLIKDKRTFYINAESDNQNYSRFIDQIGRQMYSGKENFNFCFGSKENENRTITLTFSNICDYSFDSLDVTLYDMDSYQLAVDNLKLKSLQNVAFNNSSISGDITMDEDGYLFLSIPYSEGFTAKVNGEETEILIADTAFMSLKLKSGYNKIELNYKTPYLNLGKIISFCSFCILFLIVIKDIFVLIKRKKMSSKIA